MNEPPTRTKLPRTLNRSQLATALGYARDGGGINWRGFYNYLETEIGDDWETKFSISARQRVFNTLQTEKLIEALGLKEHHF
jgi:hypothetical protein